MQKNTVIPIIISIMLVVGTVLFVSDRPAPSSGGALGTQNVEMRDGVQYVTVTAKGGYFPRMTEIKEGIPTKLIVKTNGTYDCSLSLIVRPVGFQKMLKPTGEEVIDLGTPRTGERFLGVCGMGMYSFEITVG